MSIMAAVLAALGILCMLPSGLEAKPEGVLKEAYHVNISADWLDPSVAPYNTTAQIPLYLLHDALLKPMHEGLFTPCVAESWTISPDAKIFEFKIRKGVKFHNGDPLTAEDVVFTFKRYRGGNAKPIEAKLDRVEAVNPYLVRVVFKKGFPDFLEYMLAGVGTIGWIVPKNYIEKVGDAGYKKHPVGCGPYKFVEFVPGVKLIGEAFDEYWRKVPNIKRIEILSVGEPATRLAMVKRGEVDVGTLMQGVFYEDTKKDKKLRLLNPQSTSMRCVFPTTQFDPKSPWADLRVRKAASMAIDRKTLADVHSPGSDPIGSVALEGDPSGKHFPADPYDPKGAKALLAQAGYPNGFNAGKFYPFESGYWPYGEQITTYWKAVGIKVDTILLDRPAYFAYQAAGKFKGSTFIANLVSPTIGGMLTTLFNGMKCGNYPDMQSLWEEYERTVDAKIRKDLIFRLQDLLYERRMILPLNNTTSPAAFGPKVKGNPYKIQPINWFTSPFEDIELN